MPRRKKKSKHNLSVPDASDSQSEETVIRSDDQGQLLLGSASNICQLKNSPQVGRFLVAKKNLKAGNIILSDEPIVVGPCQETKLVCIGCCILLNCEDLTSAHRCSGCGWPICGGGCSGLNQNRDIWKGGHSVLECNILKTYQEKFSVTSYNLITPLRCLLLRNENWALWKCMMTMESHDNVRRNIDTIWNLNQKTVVDPIRKLTCDQFEEELIHTVCGILEVNCFSVGENEVEARALYPRAYLLLHDCTPNTTHIDGNNFTMIIRAAVDIPKSVAITVSYTSTLYNTKRRRKELKSSKFFDCCCPRCSSSTELGTYINGVKCPECSDGWITPEKPLIEDSQWICSSCRQSVHYRLPLNISQRSESEFENLKNPIASDYEMILNKYEKLLHPHHSTLIRAKYALSQMYGKTYGHLIDEMSPETLKRKYDMCKDLLQVLDVVEPGMSRIRGVTLYECHAPLLILTQLGLASGRLSRKDAERDLRKVRELLSKAVLVLSFERPETSEGRLYEVAKQALEQAQTWPV